MCYAAILAILAELHISDFFLSTAPLHLHHRRKKPPYQGTKKLESHINHDAIKEIKCKVNIKEFRF